MKYIKGKSPYGDEEVTIGYLLEKPEDLLEAIEHEAPRAGLGHQATQFTLDEDLREYGLRPTVFPTIAVFETNDEYNYIGVRYITKEMFDALN